MTLVNVKIVFALKFSFKYTLATLIVLSLIGLGENIFISCPNVKNLKDTEWVNKESSNRKVSRCYHFIKSKLVKVANLNLKTWSKKYVLYYNRKVSIKLLSQNKLFCKIDSINWIVERSFIPRKSIENYHNSYKMTDYCLSCQNWHVVGNIMCNSLFKLKWINQQVESFDSLKVSNAWQNGFDDLFT